MVREMALATLWFEFPIPGYQEVGSLGLFSTPLCRFHPRYRSITDVAVSELVDSRTSSPSWENLMVWPKSKLFWYGFFHELCWIYCACHMHNPYDVVHPAIGMPSILSSIQATEQCLFVEHAIVVPHGLCSNPSRRLKKRRKGTINHWAKCPKTMQSLVNNISLWVTINKKKC